MTRESKKGKLRGTNNIKAGGVILVEDNNKDIKQGTEPKQEVTYKDESNRKNVWLVLTVLGIILMVVVVAFMGGQEQGGRPKNVTIIEEGYEYRATETYDEDVVAEDEEGEVLTYENGEPINIPVIKVREVLKIEDVKDDTKPDAVFGEATSYAEELAKETDESKETEEVTETEDTDE